MAEKETQFRCEQCNADFQFKCRLKEHMNEVHDKVLQFPCRMKGCNKVYAIRASRNKHEKRPHVIPGQEVVVVQKFECQFGCMRGTEVKWYATKDLREQHHARMHPGYKKNSQAKLQKRKPAPRAVGWNPNWSEDTNKSNPRELDLQGTLTAYSADNHLVADAVNPLNFKAKTIKRLLNQVAVVEPAQPQSPQLLKAVQECKGCDLAQGAAAMSFLKSVAGPKSHLADSVALELVAKHAERASQRDIDKFVREAQPLLLNRRLTSVQMQLAGAWRAQPQNARVRDLLSVSWHSAPFDVPWQSSNLTPFEAAEAESSFERLSASAKNQSNEHSSEWMLALVEADAEVQKVFSVAAFQRAWHSFDPFTDDFASAAPFLVKESGSDADNPLVAPILQALQKGQPSARVNLMVWLSSPLRWLPLLKELHSLPQGKMRSAALDFVDRDIQALDLQPEHQTRMLALLRCVRDRGKCDKLLSALFAAKTRIEPLP